MNKLLYLLIILVLAGCVSPKVTIHPISGQDIQAMAKGEPYSPTKDGWFLSDFYVEEIMRASVE